MGYDAAAAAAVGTGLGRVPLLVLTCKSGAHRLRLWQADASIMYLKIKNKHDKLIFLLEVR